MAERKVFCEECREYVEYIVEQVQTSAAVKGEEYVYLGKTARCVDCGNEIYVPEINDFNLKALYDKYREKHGIVSLEVILEIPKKYSIGKRPLSLLLGWGEQTFSRYCEGDIPTKQYSEILQKIYNEPKYYEQILENNKSKLKADKAYEKSRKAVDGLLNGESGKESEIDSAIAYLLNRCEDITPLALQKALYYIQGFHYAFYGTFLFSEDCRAWVHGPVYRDVYLKYKDYKFDPISPGTHVHDDMLTSSKKAVFESVANHICCYSGKVLEKFTHSETPWLLARGELAANEPSDRVITKESIGAYFNSVKEKYKMINPNDIEEYANVMFRKV